ncbi:MAG: PLP-dependent aminotransferase family protein [Dehalococcoidia bacterium]|nr:PLP-dependent aminotransferase family protein [Dehalococcoidia bacterium]
MRGGIVADRISRRARRPRGARLCLRRVRSYAGPHVSTPPVPEWSAAEIERLLAPVVRELMPPTALSTLPYDLNAGVPDRETLPWRELAAAATRVLEADPGGALTYGGAQGYEPLRAWIAARQAQETGLALDAAHITLTSGSAHAIDNIAATFVAPGDVVVVGAPTYPGALRTFRARGARLVAVPQDDDGLQMAPLAAALERQRASGAPAKLIYVIANYDNPSGSTLPLRRREELARIAARHRALVVEDDAYTGIDLEGPPPPSLFGVAGGQGMLRIGTFSKTIATGLRVGWVVASPAMIERLVYMRFDNGSSPLLHRMVLAYLQSGAHERHVAMLRDLYRERRDAAAAALVEQCEPYLTFRKPAGGFFHWLRLRDGLDAVAVARAAAQRGVAVTPGRNYFAAGGGEGNLRLVYSALPVARLQEAIALLGAALAEVASDGGERAVDGGTGGA